MRSRVVVVLVPVAMAALSVLALLALLEIALRVAGHDPGGRLSSQRHRFLRPSANPDLPYELVPHAEGLSWLRPVSINAHGFRDRAYPLAKRAHRIVVIGDSITFAGILDAEQRFTELLEARLRAEGRRVEVLNLGVGGYDTLNEVAFLEQVGLAFDPDRVVVAFSINDLGVHSANRLSVAVLHDYGWLIGRLRLAQLLAARVERLLLARDFERLNRDDAFRSRFAGRISPVAGDPALRRIVRELEGLLPGEAPGGPPFLAWYTSEAKIGRLRYAFERLRRSAEGRGFPVLVLIVPYLDPGAHVQAHRLAHALVAHEAGRVGFEVLDLAEAFRLHGFQKLRRKGPLHPNAAGHRLMADALYDALEDRLPAADYRTETRRPERKRREAARAAR